LSAAHHIPEATGIVTIGAPADPEHVAKQFSCDISAIEASGEAEVDLAGRKFTIKKQFLEDIRTNADPAHIADLRRALLVFHSPIDETVSIYFALKEVLFRPILHEFLLTHRDFLPQLHLY